MRHPEHYRLLQTISILHAHWEGGILVPVTIDQGQFALRFGHERARLARIIAVARAGNFASRTVLGGIVYGISYMFMQSYYSSWANLLPYVLLIAILLVRPSGLLGRRVRRA